MILFVSTVAAFTLLQIPNNTNNKNSDAYKNQNNDNKTDTNSSDNYVFQGKDFAFYDLNEEIKHLSDYTGKVVILDLWAISCKYCQYQMFELKKVYENYSADNVKILSINVNPSETDSYVEDFLDQFKKAGYELKWIFGQQKDNLNEYMPGGGIPALTIFDKNGIKKAEKTGLAFYNKIPEGYPSDDFFIKDEVDNLI